jgi:hypothetical protein
VLTTGGHPDPVIAPPPLPPGAEAATAWLLLRAFASGCTAMTGVEAVSNGMSAFKDPAIRYGHRTLAAIVVILGMLLAGIAWLATAYGIGAMDQTREGYRSVLSQLAAAVVGDGVLYVVAMASLLCVLALSANTSFVDFPRLCRMVAEDGFLPKPFAIAGRRLVFSAGILYLMAAAGLLLIVFGGITDHLIPLFAVGAFMTFTLSQTGMAVHWLRRRRSGQAKASDRTHFWINTVGAVTTGTALLVILLAKFEEGGWITVLVIPLVILLLRIIRRYYDRLDASVRDPEPLQVDGIGPPIVLVAVKDWNRLTEKALRLALGLSSDVVAIHLTQLSGPEAEAHDRALQERWRVKVEAALAGTGFAAPRLVVLQAEYRAIHEPVLTFASKLSSQAGGRRVAVLIPEVVKRRWYQHLLHAHHARHLRSQLLRHAGGRLTVINVPWHFEAAEP